MSAYAVPVALAAAAAFAAASVLQQRAVRLDPSDPGLDPRLLLRVLRRPLWWAGGTADLAGVGLQTLALAKGALALVQPLLVSGLILAVPLGAAFDRRWPGRRDLTAVLLAVLGLSAFLLIAAPAGGGADPSPRAWIVIASASAPAITGCLLLAHRSTGGRRAAYLGLATGGLYGVTSALLKVCAERLTGGHPLSLLTTWEFWALVIAGATGLALNQNAFQDGPLAASLTALTLTEPVVGVAIGATAFHEHLCVSGVRAPLLAAAAVTMTYAIWLTSTGRPPAVAEA